MAGVFIYGVSLFSVFFFGVSGGGGGTGTAFK
jgi:hypothetical protein